MLAALLSPVIDLVERGHVPDAVVRAHVCTERA